MATFGDYCALLYVGGGVVLEEDLIIVYLM